VCVLLCSGHTVEQTVDVVNGEVEPISFSVLQASLLSEDQQSGLILRPTTGTVAPKARSGTNTKYNWNTFRIGMFRNVLESHRK